MLHARAAQPGGIIQAAHSVLAVKLPPDRHHNRWHGRTCFKGTSSRQQIKSCRPDGVSTYLALTFGTLLSSQGTDASFGPVSGPSGRFPSVFPTLSVVPTLSDHCPRT
ncbi:hypothetical protein Sfr7A_31105 [Streptomyces xinghaiensis]|uniref:Uncharacterized protein n=1 Tax=Streptomyces xinghaiensis TaxID=1038928 RepID=A0A3R7EIK5_9ACTN|nr:hypothetical protein Sfr7A_31105 [Streptomyces xinghaiensis]RKM90148.1 hypothetical protein SFRA_031975 [Streptomyces xinghaiensis]RNC68435.1 hypothetical protein DC095_032170 [Streptomyces xinghaiensis]